MPRLTSGSRSLAGKAVLVTGAASGMGRATAHLFADETFEVFARSQHSIQSRRRHFQRVLAWNRIVFIQHRADRVRLNDQLEGVRRPLQNFNPLCDSSLIHCLEDQDRGLGQRQVHAHDRDRCPMLLSQRRKLQSSS